MRKFLVLILATALLVTLGGCFRPKSGGSLVEGLIEHYVSADVNIDDDGITIEGEDGSEYSFGGTKWPSKELDGVLPELKKGTISSVITGDDGVYIFVDEVSMSDYESYRDSVKGDFETNAYSADSEDYSTYMGENSRGVTLQLIYSDGSLAIYVYPKSD